MGTQPRTAHGNHQILAFVRRDGRCQRAHIFLLHFPPLRGCLEKSHLKLSPMGRTTAERTHHGSSHTEPSVNGGNIPCYCQSVCLSVSLLLQQLLRLTPSAYGTGLFLSSSSPSYSPLTPSDKSQRFVLSAQAQLAPSPSKP